MPPTDKDEAKSRSDESFAARRRFITELRGFRRTGTSSKAEPRAFRDYNLWGGKDSILDEIIVGCSRLEVEEDADDFLSQLDSLLAKLEYINPNIRLGRFELLQVYNHLLDHPYKRYNLANRWKDICLEFVNETAATTSNRYLSSVSYTYQNYVTVYKRLMNAWVELRFGRGSSTQYTECMRHSIEEKGLGLIPHKDHPGFCFRKKKNAGASQAASTARPTPGNEAGPLQPESNRGPNGGASVRNGADHDPRQGGRFRPHEAPMEGKLRDDRLPVGGMGGHASNYARFEPSNESQYPGQGRPNYDTRQERANYDPRENIRSHPLADPMYERRRYDSFPVGRTGGQPYRYPEDEPFLEPPYGGRAPLDNRSLPQRRASMGQADWTESDVRAMRNRMAGY